MGNKNMDDNWGKSGRINAPKNLKEDLEQQKQIKKFSDYQELADFLQDRDTGHGGNFGPGLGFMASRARPLMEEAEFTTGPRLKSERAVSDNSASYSGADDHSKTNVQVKGVDEADIIKNDGKYVYAVSKNSLFIINAYPPEEAEVLTEIKFRSKPDNIYIDGNSLAVFGRDTKIKETKTYERFRRRHNYTFLKIFNISDKKNPKELRDLDFEGNYSDSRRVGDYIYFVTDYRNFYYAPSSPLVPRLIEDGKELSLDCEKGERCFAPDVYYFDMPYRTHDMVTVSSINIKNEKEPINSDVYVMPGNHDMYSSKDNIYLTYTKRMSEYQLVMSVVKDLVSPRLSADNRSKIREIEAVPAYVLTKNEKMEKAGNIVERYIMSLEEKEREDLQKKIEKELKDRYESLAEEMEKTVVHRIAIKKGEMEHEASGEVSGSVLNQFSMDERDGYFRIATTKSRTWSGYIEDKDKLESYSNLYVMDKDLNITGSVKGLAPGESIYSVRFMQNRAYMVTFERIDPLFVIDLQDPRDPEVLGELKIPGFSQYLHPYDNNLLIGIGKQTKETEYGRIREDGLKLSLFDVSNVSEPKEVDVYIMGDAGSDSIALNDHKAFLFSKDRNLLSIPVSIREDDSDRGWGKLSFSGAAVFKLNESGFELIGKIDHKEEGDSRERNCRFGYCHYDSDVLRSFYMDDTLYTFSNKYLKMNSLPELKEKGKLKIKKENEEYEIIN